MAVKRKETFTRFVIHRFLQNKLGVLGLVIITFLIIIALLAPVIANDIPLVVKTDRGIFFPILFKYSEFRNIVDWRSFVQERGWKAIFPPIPYSPVRSSGDVLSPPSSKHLLGTDDIGRDVLARMIHGTRVSLAVGIVSMGTAFLIGITIGLLAGYFGGLVDMVLSRIIEVFMTFPTFFLILTILAFLPPSIYNVMFVIGLTGWTGIARLVRGEVLKVKEMDFVKYAKAIGTSDFRIILWHILPNSIYPALISLAFGIADAVLVESALSFLGLGVQPPTPSWGAILQAGRENIEIAWWLTLFPGIAIFLTVSGYNLIGEALRDALDPRVYIKKS